MLTALWWSVVAAATVPSGRAVEVRRPVDVPISIAAGAFRYGASDDAIHAAEATCPEDYLGNIYRQECNFMNEGHERTVWLGAFRIDRVEATVAAYRDCVHSGNCSPEPLLATDPRFADGNLPITSVTWPEANAFCAWRGGRLPTEAEWERAARGRERRVWPWGSSPRNNSANHGRFRRREALSPSPATFVEPDASDGFGLLAPVGSFPDGASPDGVLDLAGNAAEWTADGWQSDRQTLSRVAPLAPPTGDQRVVRGGSFRVPLVFLRTTARQAAPSLLRSPEIGFRCTY